MSLPRCTLCLSAAPVRSRTTQSAAARQLLASAAAYRTLHLSTPSRNPSSSPRSSVEASTSKATTEAPTSSAPSPSKSSSPPPLPRPLGLPQPPRKHVKLSLRQRAERMMDKDAKMAERKHMCVVDAAVVRHHESSRLMSHPPCKPRSPRLHSSSPPRAASRKWAKATLETTTSCGTRAERYGLLPRH